MANSDQTGAACGHGSGKGDLTGSYCTFQEPWWLNLVTEGNWDEVVIRNEKLLGRLPYCVKRKLGVNVVTQPPFTPFLGPWISCHGPDTKGFADQYAILGELIAELPQFDIFRHNFWPELQNWLPFYWTGFSQTTCYTYWLRDTADPNAVWSGFSQSARRAVRRAEHEVAVVATTDVDRLCSMYERTFAQQGKPPPYGKRVLSRIAEGALRAGRGRISYACDTQGNMHAVNFVVFDDRTAHYLVGGSDDRFRKSGAASLLMWDAIKFAAERHLVFDFEGSMVAGIERFFRTFNPSLIPYNRVSKVRGMAGTLIHFRNAVTSLMGRPPLRI